MNDLFLFYNKPASVMNKNDTWQEETLPIGNGIIGATVWGEIQKERLTINEETLWDCGRNHEDPNDSYNGGNPDKDLKTIYKTIASQVRNGESFDKEQLAGLYDGYSNGYQPMGDLIIEFPSLPKKAPKDYVRSLSLSNGTAQVNFSVKNKKYSRKYFVSNPDNVLVCVLECENGTLDFSVSLSTHHAAASKAIEKDGHTLMAYEGKLKDSKLCFSAVYGIDTDGKESVERASICVKNAKKAVIYFSCGTDYANEFYNKDKTITYYYRSGETAAEVTKKATQRVLNALSQGCDEVYRKHIDDFSSLYNRLTLNLGQRADRPTNELLRAYRKGNLSKEEKRYLEVLMFQYGRYLLISASRKNSRLPTNLQGIWNGFEHAAWNSDIHININEQMNYWLSSNANLNECALPLVEYVSRLKEPGSRTAKAMFDSEHGFIAHTQNTPFGFTATGWAIQSWGWCPAGIAWILQNCYDYYEYSLDEETLKSTIYPMMKDQVLFYEDILTEYNGRKLMPIGQSPEVGSLTFSNTYEQSLIWQLYADTIEAAEILGVDAEEVIKWKDTLEKLSPIEIGQSGQVKEWYHETEINSVNDTRKHRHLSNLLGLYPGNLFDTEEKKNAAYVSLMNKQFGRVGTKLNPEGGWTYAQMMNTWARLGNGDNAYFSFERMIQNRLYDNLFDYHKYGKYGAFQIDANYGCTAGVCEMLVQSNLGYIEILPALPKEWSSGSFEGITAEGAFEIDARWENMKLTGACVTSRKGQKCKIKISDDISVTDENKAGIVSERNGDIIEFETVAGGKYYINF